jgi:REP element-mobilizing transposase RayT
MEVTLPPCFQAPDPARPIRIYTRNLPHWRQDGATYFVTFRLVDSIPSDAWRSIQREAVEWRDRVEREALKSGGAVPGAFRLEYETFQHRHLSKVESILDSGLGSCVLAQSEVRQVVTDALKFFDGTRYRLHAFVVMPNHVHLCVTPMEGWELEELLKSWKGFTSRQINLALKRTGSLWQSESYNRIIRDAEHFARVVRYIGKNAVKVGLDADAYSLWLGCARWVQDEGTVCQEEAVEYGVSYPS